MQKRFVIILLLMGILFFSSCQKSEDLSNSTAGNSKTAAKTGYHCPMHPEVVAEKPSTCPICFMALVPDQQESAGNVENGQLTISTNRQQLAGVVTEKAVIRSLSAETEAFGTVELAENQKKIIAARFNGRIEKLYADQSGLSVKAGQPLFSFYSQDLLTVQNEYLQLLKNYPDQPNLLEPVRERLILFGLTHAQIKNLEESRKAKPVLDFYAPYGGLILDKKVVEGQYFSEGTTLYEIGGLNPIWVIAEINAADVNSIANQQTMILYPENNPGESYEGTVIYKNPVVGRDNRLVKIRLAVKNPGNTLFAGTFVKVLVPHQYVAGVTVPEEAVIFTGKRTVVWLKSDSVSFKAAEVEIGGKAEGYYLISKGIAEGDEVVKNGAYLIDSESSLKSGK